MEKGKAKKGKVEICIERFAQMTNFGDQDLIELFTKVSIFKCRAPGFSLSPESSYRMASSGIFFFHLYTV